MSMTNSAGSLYSFADTIQRGCQTSAEGQKQWRQRGWTRLEKLQNGRHPKTHPHVAGRLVQPQGYTLHYIRYSRSSATLRG